MTSIYNNVDRTRKHYFEQEQSDTRAYTTLFKPKLWLLMWGLTRNEHEKSFGGDRNVLNLAGVVII